MKIKSAEFHLSAPNLKSSPDWALPEFAFIGRSNVGKSSLINLLTERRELAKVSVTPGKTQLINFFVVNRSWCLVDLPGYGYAHVSEHKRRGFNEAVADFLIGRRNLRRAFVLIDSRLPPQAIDTEFLRWLDAEGVPFSLIFTKADKQSAAKGETSVQAFRQAMGRWRALPPQVFVSSAKSRLGRTEILSCIDGLLGGAPTDAG